MAPKRAPPQDLPSEAADAALRQPDAAKVQAALAQLRAKVPLGGLRWGLVAARGSKPPDVRSEYPLLGRVLTAFFKSAHP